MHDSIDMALLAVGGSLVPVHVHMSTTRKLCPLIHVDSWKEGFISSRKAWVHLGKREIIPFAWTTAISSAGLFPVIQVQVRMSLKHDTVLLDHSGRGCSKWVRGSQNLWMVSISQGVLCFPCFHIDFAWQHREIECYSCARRASNCSLQANKAA